MLDHGGVHQMGGTGMSKRRPAREWGRLLSLRQEGIVYDQ
jgi:hypothetical protein